MESGIGKNVVILTAVHPFKASGIVAFDLMQNLKETGVNVVIISNEWLEKEYENTISLKTIFGYIKSKIARRISKYFLIKTVVDPNYYMYGIDQVFNNLQAKKIVKLLPFKPDAFIYIFPQFFLTTQDLQYLNKKTQSPVFWYMMDMAAITGGCHYANNCNNYITMCGKCPGIFSDVVNDKANKIWKQKKSHIDNSTIIPIAASEWQYNQLKESALFKNRKFYKILLPINNNIFKLGDKNKARDILNIPHVKKIIFFGAVSVKEKRKGFKELIESLILLNSMIDTKMRENIHIIIAGKTDFELESKIPFNHTFLGFLNYNQLAQAFQSADIFLCPSIEDSGPMMINQSIMCGTPVVSFEMGVAIDLVITNETGYRATLKDSNDLARGIKTILEMNHNEYNKMRNNCLGLSNKFCDKKIFASHFIDLLTN